MKKADFHLTDQAHFRVKQMIKAGGHRSFTDLVRAALYYYEERLIEEGKLARIEVERKSSLWTIRDLFTVLRNRFR